MDKTGYEASNTETRINCFFENSNLFLRLMWIFTGKNSLKGADVPNDIKNTFGLPKKGW